MKVAIMISGLIRRNELGYDHLKKMILEPNSNHDIDIYLDIWNNKISKYENKGAEWRQERRSKLNFEDKHDLNQLYEMYSPSAFKIENDSDSIFFESLANKIKNGHVHKATPYAIYSQFYKLYSADIMRQARERYMGFKYDVCVRAREESIYENPILLDSFDLTGDKIYVENERWNGYDKKFGWTSDKFAICSSDVIVKYSSFGLNIKSLNEQLFNKTNTTPEIYLNQYLLAMGITPIKDNRIGKIGRF